MRTIARAGRPIAAVATTMIVFSGFAAACGSDSVEIAVSPAAQQGRTITRSEGCAGCHGASGQGGVGPTFVGLYGSTVNLDDGSSVMADEAYLTQAIRDPRAVQVEGYRLPMPVNSLTDDEIALVVQYIEELAEVAP